MIEIESRERDMASGTFRQRLAAWAGAWSIVFLVIIALLTIGRF